MSTTFRPNLSCTIAQRTGGFDIHGRPEIGTPRKSKCAIVRLKNQAEKTSVRADSSASRGMAEELLHDARLLLKPSDVVAIGTIIEVTGLKLEVKSIFPRYEIIGRLHHWEVDCDIWSDD